MNHLTEEALDFAALLAETADPEAGALVVFGGTVRFDGRVEAINYTAYAPLAARTLTELEAETRARFPDVRSCRLLHRLGLLKTGELSVLVVVRAGHRAEAFAAAHWAIDTLKVRVPVWKQEHYTDGTCEYLEGVPLQTSTKVP
jgi:molybdopterin synthase catalytic subunit